MNIDQTTKRRDTDMSGWEIEAVSQAEFEFKSWPRTSAGVVTWVNKIFMWFPEPELVRITFFREGPFCKPSKGEENNLSCWHHETEEEIPGYLLKWQTGDAVAYKFVPPESLAAEICELVNSRITKICAFQYPGPASWSNSEPGL